MRYNMLLKTEYGVLQHREHKHSFRSEMKASSMAGLKLSLDENIGLKDHHRLFVDHGAARWRFLNPKRRATTLIGSLCSGPLLNDHDLPPSQLDVPLGRIVPDFYGRPQKSR